MATPAPPRFLGGYGPVLVVGIVLVLVAAFVPSVSRDEPIDSTALATASEDQTTTGTDDTGTTVDTGTTIADAAAGGTGASTKPKTTGQAAGATNGAKPGITTGCAGRQVKGDPYAPPCFKWGGGDNGGATSHGVTGDTITVTIREGTFDKGVIDAVSKAALKQGASNFLAGETPELIRSTIEGLVDYFNTRYELFGRKIALRWLAPKGDVLAEILGGGQEGAEADAITATNELGAFADVSAISPAYADALGRRGVLAIGAPYMSQQWLTSRAPYQWSGFTDCDTIVNTVTSYYIAKLGHKPAAYAGGDLKGKPRKVGVVAPDSDWFQSCVAGMVQTLRGAGLGDEASLEPFTYRLDLNAMAPQAYSVVPQLVANGATTVLCACDPLMLLFLTAKAREQGYRPEWVETGAAFSDQDAVAEIFDQTSWNGAFGVSFGGDLLTLAGGPGYRAFQSVRPGQVPSKTVEALFYQIQLLAIGIQMAGPNLTPKTFEAGMFRYPATGGPAGTWDFGPGDYTGPGDAREVYYSAATKSTATGGAGAWIDPSNGSKRYQAGRFASGEPVTGG
jgi:hypothetical protein